MLFLHLPRRSSSVGRASKRSQSGATLRGFEPRRSIEVREKILLAPSRDSSDINRFRHVEKKKRNVVLTSDGA